MGFCALNSHVQALHLVFDVKREKRWEQTRCLARAIVRARFTGSFAKQPRSLSARGTYPDALLLAKQWQDANLKARPIPPLLKASLFGVPSQSPIDKETR